MTNNDTQKIVLYVALAFVGFLLWQTWQHDYPRTPANPTVHKVSAVQHVGSLTATTVDSRQGGTLPAPDSRLLQVETDLMKVSIDLKGGSVIRLNLKNYPERLGDKSKTVQLLSDDSEKLYLARSGIFGLKDLVYRVQKRNFSLDGSNSIVVNLVANQKGIEVNKRLTFQKNSYVVKQEYIVKNRSRKTYQSQFYNQLVRKNVPTKKSSSYFGSFKPSIAISTPEKRYLKIPFKKLESSDVSRSVKGGWVAMLQHYFVSAWIPNNEQTYHFYSRVDGDLYEVGMLSQSFAIVPGKEYRSRVDRLYVGPEITDRLGAVAPGLNLTIDFGWLWLISSALFKAMKWIHDFVGNWGWSIILVTLLIKLGFYRLSASSYRSMAQMRKLQPKLEALKERFADNRQELGRATMELYRSEKMNPLGGCLPVVVQIPVFLALYWVLIESVELRQAPWIFWIHDLSAKDPYYILPILMGITMVLQQKMSPPPPDPAQAKMMMLLPLVFVVFSVNFPSGLVLYWVVNSALSILQQWYVTRRVEQGAYRNSTGKRKKRR